MLVRRLLIPVFLLAMLSVVVLIAPRPAFAISDGCATAQVSTFTGTFPGLQGFFFDAGDQLTVTISNTAKDTTAELLIDSVVVDSAPLTAGQSVTLEYTFTASSNYTVDSRSFPESATHRYGCTPAPSGSPSTPAPGPGIPSDFVLRTITCDTPLYTTANGSPVPGGAAVKVGQTWFIAPDVEEGTPDWIEGFFGGKNNAWLPANCVG